MMIPSLIILCSLLVVAAILYIHHVFTGGGSSTAVLENAPDASHDDEKGETGVAGANTDADSGVCCGMHDICEKYPAVSASAPVYYDDEELDIFAGRAPDSYTDSETEQFRDVLLTLLPHDVYGWQKSMEARGIKLPPGVRDELMLRLSESS